MSEIIIAEYTPADKASCLELLQTIFPGSSDVETFKWRFESGLSHSPIVVCAKDHGKVISFNSWLPWEFVYKEKVFLGYQSGESATYKEYRRKGILGKVLRFADGIARGKNVDFLFGFPSAMIYTTFYNSGYYPIGIYPYRLRFINPLNRSQSEPTEIDYEAFSKYLLRDNNKITAINNHEYFNWRYIDNTKKYFVLSYQENNNQAIFILRPTVYHNKRFHIRLNELILVDCHFTSYNEIFINSAFKHIDRIFSGRFHFLRSFVSEQTDRGRAICSHFHIKIKSRFEILCIKPVNDTLDYSFFLNHYNWDIMPHVIDEM